jgi:hypothetical protein
MRTDAEVYNRIVHMSTRNRDEDLFHNRLRLLLAYYLVTHDVPVLSTLDTFVDRCGIDLAKIAPLDEYSAEHLRVLAVESIEVGWDCAETHQMVELLRCIHEAVELGWILGHDEEVLEEIL